MNVQIQMILLQFHYSVDTLFKISHIHSYFHLAWASLTPKTKMSWVHGCGNQTQVAKLDGRCLYPLGILPTLISDFMTNNTQLVRSMEIFPNVPDQNRKNFLFYILQMRVFSPPKSQEFGSRKPSLLPSKILKFAHAQVPFLIFTSSLYTQYPIHVKVCLGYL